MADQIRETQFGLLVRVLSGKRLFQYPDEVDLSFSKALHQESNTSPTFHEQEDEDREEPSVGNCLQHGNMGCQQSVDWWNENDPEVSDLNGLEIAETNESFAESSKLVIGMEIIHRWANMPNELHFLHCKFHIHTWRKEYHG